MKNVDFPIANRLPGRLLLALFVGLATAGCWSPAAAQTPVAKYGNLRVQGTQILDRNNLPVSLAGNSLFWSNAGWGGERYYTANVVNWLKTSWNAGVVRAAMGVDEAGGYLENPAREKAKVKAVVDACVAAGLYVIIDWHSHHAEQHQAEAVAFFREMATTYGTTPNVIYEIYNEPLQVSWSGVVKPYAQAVVGAIRAIDPDNLIVVGTPTWSQDVDVAAADPVPGVNIAYTLHFYAATHKNALRDKARAALSRGVALFVTEYGTCEASGSGIIDATSTQEWMDFMKLNKISHCNWSVNDKAEAASALVPGTDPAAAWSDSYLTTSGRLVKGYVQNWNNAGTAPPASGTATKVEAESYHVMSGVQTETTTDVGGGLNVGYIDAGDWMAYTVTVPTAGTYTLEFRVASLNGGGQISVEQNSGATKLGTVAVPSTGGWQNWTTISRTVTLSAGSQDIALGVPAGGYNLNWWSFAKTAARPAGSPLATASSETLAPTLFPNPVRQQLHLALARPGTAARLLVFDASGQRVLSQELPASNLPEATVSVEALAPGIYTLRVEESGHVTTSKLVKE